MNQRFQYTNYFNKLILLQTPLLCEQASLKLQSFQLSNPSVINTKLFYIYSLPSLLRPPHQKLGQCLLLFCILQQKTFKKQNLLVAVSIVFSLIIDK